MEKLSIGWKRSARNNTKSDECGRGNQIFQPLIHTNKHESVLSSLVSIGVYSWLGLRFCGGATKRGVRFGCDP